MARQSVAQLALERMDADIAAAEAEKQLAETKLLHLRIGRDHLQATMDDARAARIGKGTLRTTAVSGKLRHAVLHAESTNGPD